jgi:hypothetical protein
MIISVHQTLHGYQSGHQLLANSIPLSDEANKILLLQSDLSGTLSNLNFESYLTGYPLRSENLYAFAKSWYAREMKRPGCVWTQTFLIKFNDLGKIPDLQELVKLFIRPKELNFDHYNTSIELDFNLLLTKSEKLKNRDINLSLYTNVYEHPDASLIIPSSSPLPYEDDILNLWSNQWPRLRRNFSFCSGAMALKNINNKAFDIQVVPIEVFKSVTRTADKLHFFDLQSSTKSAWLNAIVEHEKNELRRFMWTFGTDVQGKRDRFIPLIKLYQATHSQVDLGDINNLISESFANSKEAKNLKTRLYTEDGLITYPDSEKQIVKYLVLTTNIDFLDGIALNLENRLINLLYNDIIEVNELLNWITNAPKGRISDEIWDKLEITDSVILNLLHNNKEFAYALVLKSDNIIYNRSAWELPFEQQKLLLELFIKHNRIRDWNRLIHVILDASSNIIFELYWQKQEMVFHTSLEWFNSGQPDRRFTEEWKKFIVNERDYILIKWLKQNEKRIHSKTFAFIFDNLQSHKVISLGFSHNTWLIAYKKLKTTEYKVNLVYISTILLAIGFNDNIPNAEWLASATFLDVYNFAQNLRLDQHDYNLIPKDSQLDSDNEDAGILETIFNLLRTKPKKHYQVESWDYCEHLIRTLCNKTIKNNWNPGAFLSTLKDPAVFYRAISYCATFKKGRQLIQKVFKHIENRQIKFEDFQYQYLRKSNKIH